MENFRRQWNLDHITVTKILNCFRTNGGRKWRNRFKKKKPVVWVKYLEQQTDYTWEDIEEKLPNQGENPSWRNQACLPFLSKQMETMPRSYQQSATWSQNDTEKVLRFHWNCKQLRVEAKNNCQIVRFSSHFSLKLTYNFENIFTAWYLEV